MANEILKLSFCYVFHYVMNCEISAVSVKLDILLLQWYLNLFTHITCNLKWLCVKCNHKRWLVSYCASKTLGSAVRRHSFESMTFGLNQFIFCVC
jgi:hypothetical protein